MICSEAVYGQALAPYLDDPGNVFVISSDFCHWGARFNFTFYDKAHVSQLSLHAHAPQLTHLYARKVIMPRKCRVRSLNLYGG